MVAHMGLAMGCSGCTACVQSRVGVSMQLECLVNVRKTRLTCGLLDKAGLDCIKKKLVFFHLLTTSSL